MILKEIKFKKFTIIVETECNDDFQLYVYKTEPGELEVLFIHQEYDTTFTKEEVLSIGLSYAEAM